MSLIVQMLAEKQLKVGQLVAINTQANKVRPIKPNETPIGFVYPLPTGKAIYKEGELTPIQLYT